MKFKLSPHLIFEVVIFSRENIRIYRSQAVKLTGRSSVSATSCSLTKCSAAQILMAEITHNSSGKLAQEEHINDVSQPLTPSPSHSEGETSPIPNGNDEPMSPTSQKRKAFTIKLKSPRVMISTGNEKRIITGFTIRPVPLISPP